ncbi:hypothetical protein CVT25_009334 [Psilocybe cyanescens]|uniref:DUF6533 domain-containing protein n=1 Tax=Psilocybe cyanescens TaxID=93625 RepID=A0A409VNC4_PSICY|nr:hypothetical protein CVT25_009334 [Psilocybe cyanescens]
MANPSVNCTPTIDIPNPCAPMAFLPPQMAFQATITSFLVALSLGALIWDILPNLGEEYQLLFKRRFQLCTVVYFLSRISTVIYLIGVNVVQMSIQIGNCRQLFNFLSACFVISHATTAFLLYFRVCAVYSMNRSAVAFFGICWIGVIIGSATIFWAFEGVHVGPTQFCTAMLKHEYIIATSGADLINDTLVFGAIVYKLGVSNLRRGRTAPWQAFTISFLQDSQMYYLISVITNFITIVIFFAVKTPSDSLFRIMMIIPDTTILNIMACRVYRNVKFGRHTQVSFTQPSLAAHATDPIHFNPNDSDGDAAGTETPSPKYIVSSLGHSQSGDLDVEKRGPSPMGIEVTKVIELMRD